MLSLILPQNATAKDYEEFNLNNRQLDAILKMRNDEESFSYNSYAEVYGISKSTAKRDLNTLYDKNLIRKITMNQSNYFFI